MPYMIFVVGGLMFGVGVLRANRGYDFDFVHSTPRGGSGCLVPLGIGICALAIAWAMLP